MGIKKEEFIENGNQISVEAGKVLYEYVKDNAELCESLGLSDFQEDNNMSNSTELYTTSLANFIYYKSYNKFQKYFDNVLTLTPADLGMPEGSGAYQIPKIRGATAVKLSSGETVDYVNDNKDESTLTTESHGVGTRINRRLVKRGAKGFISKFMASASDAVLRSVTSDLVNGMVSAADSNNTVSTGISVDAIADAQYNIEQATDANGVLFGFTANVLGLTSEGKRTLIKSSDYKDIFKFGQNNIPGDSIETQYMVYDGMNVVTFELVTATKNSKAVHALVYDREHYMAFLRETQMEVFDGRLPGTAGDQEIIHAMDTGYVAMNAEACAVITAA